jgi:hypothetical protein
MLADQAWRKFEPIPTGAPTDKPYLLSPFATAILAPGGEGRVTAMEVKTHPFSPRHGGRDRTVAPSFGVKVER